MNWESSCSIHKFEILLVGRGENHWHLQHQKRKKSHEGQAEDGNRASGIPRRRKYCGGSCYSQICLLAEVLYRTGRHKGRKGKVMNPGAPENEGREGHRRDGRPCHGHVQCN